MDTRLRRLRMTKGLRRLATENVLSTANLVFPMFVCEGSGVRRAIPSMPGVFNLSVDELVREVATFADKDLGAVLLFGIPDVKDETGSSGCAEQGVVQK